MAGLKPLLKDIADAIRAKSGTTAVIPASEFANRIGTLKLASAASRASSGSLGDGTAYGSFIPSGVTFSDKTLVITGSARCSVSEGSGILSGLKIMVTFSL